MAGFARLLQWVLRYKGAVGVAGLIVLCGLLILLQILRLPIFAPVGAAGTVGLLSLIIKSVFWLSVTAVVVSGLAFILPARLFVPTSRLQYAVAVFRMIDPIANPIAAINERFEPYVGFPYYSRESDHPSYWPGRVGRDRLVLAERFDTFYGHAEVQAALAAARAKTGDTSSVEVHSSAPGGAEPISAVIAGARLFFNFHLNGDASALVAALGEPIAREMLAIEEARNQQRHFLPNRIAIIRVRNAGPRTIRDVIIEYEVAGYVYDTKIRAVFAENTQPFLPFEHRLVIPKLLAGQAYDISIWYHYQSVRERVFPDKINFIQELTQGFTVSNIAVATGGKVVFDPDLLKSVPAYDRLYDGDGRQSDNPEPMLALYFKANAAEAEAAIKTYDEEHLKRDDLTIDALAELPLEEAQIDSVWVGFRSPAGKTYRAVCVYAHPNGPYALLASTDRDRNDFAAVKAALAVALSGKAEAGISDRSDDICATIEVATGFTRQAITAAFRNLAEIGYRDARVEKVHYRKVAA